MNTIDSEILNENSVVLITGGARGITSQCAIRIAETAKCKLILVGRSTLLKSEPEWASGAEGSQEIQMSALAFFKEAEVKITPKDLQKEVKQILSNREINTTLKKIKDAGGSAMYLSADVTDQNSLTSKIHESIEKMGPVTGIIHGAGNLADKRIENKTAEDFDLVVHTKVFGLENIIKSVDPDSLRFLVLFSSVAGFFGNVGQTDYAIANEILNKSAHIIQRTLPNCRVLSINWGPWDSGMVSPELKKLFQERNIQLISTDFGVETLISELTSADSKEIQIVVGNPLGESNVFAHSQSDPIKIQRQINHADNPFLDDHCIGQQAVLPATCASAWLADTCLSLHPGSTFYMMEDFKILKGLTFNNDIRTYDIELKPELSDDPSLKTYDVIITSSEKTGRKIFHYSGKVTLTGNFQKSPLHPPSDQLVTNGVPSRDGGILYEDGTLFHGPYFQGIKEVLQLDEKRVVTKISLPEMSSQAQGQFYVRSSNPYINDAVVQSLLIWTQEFYDAPCLPSRLHQWMNYKVVPFDQTVWATLDITYHNEHAVIGDLRVQDKDGHEFFHFSGLEGTVSKQLKRFIGRKGK